MLVLLLLVGVSLSSPVPLSTDQAASGKDEKGLLSTSSSSNMDVPLRFAENIDAIASFSVPQRQDASFGIAAGSLTEEGSFRAVEGPSEELFSLKRLEEENIDRDEDYEVANENIKFSIILEPQNTDVRRLETIEQPTPERLPRNSILPPIIFAQQSSDISLEPTEVEAPGTTPTTVSMITEATVNAFRNSTNKPSIFLQHEEGIFPFSHRNSFNNKTDERDFNLSNKSEASSINASTDILNSHEDGHYSDHTGIVNLKSSSLDSNVDKNKNISQLNSTKETHSLDSFLQKDNSKSALDTKIEDIHSDFNSRFKIKTFNNTYTLVHEREDSLSKSSDATYPNENPKTSLSINSSEKHSNDSHFQPANYSETNEQLSHDKQKEEYVEEDAQSIPDSEMLSYIDNSQVKPRESKRIVTAAELLLNISNHRTLFRSFPSARIGDTHKLKASDIIIQENIQGETPIDTATKVDYKGSERKDSVTNTREADSEPEINVKYNEKILIPNPDENANNEEGNSNIETREVDNDSFFILVDSNLAPIKVKKDDADIDTIQSKTQDENGYRMDVITSSSEVTYKQFDPLKNSSNISNNFGSSHTSDESSGDSDNKLKYMASENSESNSPQKVSNINSNSSSPNKETPNGHEELINNSERNSDNTSSEEQIVTSLPSQTSVVEPLRTNASSSLAEVTLPSLHHRTKSDQNANSHSISSPLTSDSSGRSPLGILPEESSHFGDSQTPPVQQERVSVPISEHVSPSISAGCVVAIVSGVLLSMIIVGGAVAYFLYQRLEGFRPKILSSDRSCANSDSGGYLDDQCRVAYVNSQIDLPKSTPEDLVSLDNDSFLNSLESMTIQNLWTDSIRHTKL